MAGSRGRFRHGGVVALAGLSMFTLTVPLAEAASASGHSVVVVKKAQRGSFGAILVTAHGVALYRDSSDKPNTPTCTGGCASIWPPLLLPKGIKLAKGGSGVTGLGTVKVSNGRLQVTYHQMPLYTFASDSGTSVTGQGVGGFAVVHLTAARPKTTTHSPTNSTTVPGY